MNQSNITKLSDFIKSEYFKLINYARGIIYEIADRNSQDIVQDVITRIFETADISAPIEDIAAYVYRALKNRVIDIMRKKEPQISSIDERNNSLSLLQVAGDLKNMPETLYERNEIYNRLYDAIKKLPVDLKSVLVMNEIDGKTFKQISEYSGIPAGTLMARKARAIKILKKELKNYKNFMEE